MLNLIRTILILILTTVSFGTAFCCTSMVVGVEKSASGRPMLWKHRDTGADNNFLARIEPTDSTAGYVALFNAGDSLLEEAWMGMNDRGFAIMNTASYNLPDFESELTDREGAIMNMALKYCRNLNDFEDLLRKLPKPLGVQANFGVIDADGGAAYYETSDTKWIKFDVNDTPEGYIIRTNHSKSGTGANGRGYIRYATAEKLASEHQGLFHPYDFTEDFSRSFYHSLFCKDFSDEDIVVDIDFIPRDISTASLVIEGVNFDMSPSEIRMWGCVGYPPCSVSKMITLSKIPEDFQNDGETWRSKAGDVAAALRRSALPLEVPEGSSYIDMRILDPINRACREKSLSNWLESENM